MKEKIFSEKYRNIVLHIPHSSIRFPEGSQYHFNDLDAEERLLIDYFTDDLFEPKQHTEHISSMVFPYCRLFADVERLINDPLEEEGLGISYCRRNTNSCPDRSFSTMSSAFNLYADFHAEVSKHIVELACGVLLIDCHSFSALPNLLNSNPPDIDICVGYNDDETCPDDEIIETIVQHFKSIGYKVGINQPFSNSKTFAVPVKYHTIMIEVNKRLYMNEKTIDKIQGFARLQRDIQGLYEVLLL